MRPPKYQQSALRTPLNKVLGTEANVRILRVLCSEPFALTRTELGRRCGLEHKGAHLAANKLIDAGILRLVGAGARQQVELETQHPLARPLQELFWAEINRVESLINSLKSAVRGLSTQIESAWIQGSFAREEDTEGDALTIGIVANSRELADAATKLRECIRNSETTLDQTVEIVSFTKPDLIAASSDDRAAWRKIIQLFGIAPLEYIEPGRANRKISLHDDREAAQMAMARAIAERLRRDPSIANKAQAFVRKRIVTASQHEQHELQEWKQILETMSPPRLAKFLTDSSERATRLRQTMPFLNILTKEERDSIRAAIRDAE